MHARGDARSDPRPGRAGPGIDGPRGGTRGSGAPADGLSQLANTFPWLPLSPLLSSRLLSSCSFPRIPVQYLLPTLASKFLSHVHSWKRISRLQLSTFIIYFYFYYIKFLFILKLRAAWHNEKYSSPDPPTSCS